MEIALIVLGLLVLVLGATLLYDRRRRTTPGASPTELTHGPYDAGQPTQFILEDGSGRQLFAEIVDRTEAALWKPEDELSTHQPSLVAVDKAIAAIPAIGLALKGGKVARILNPEALAQGRQLKSAKGGNLSLIYGEKSIVTQLRYGDTRNVATVAAPLAVFQVASAITGQYYLDRINGQLIAVEGQISRFRIEHRNATYGDITAAAEACAELEEGFSRSLALTADDRTRLVSVETLIDKAYNQKQKDVDDFVRDVESVFATDALGVSDVDRLLREADHTALYDVQLLTYAAAIRHKLNLLRAYADFGAADGRGEIAERKVAREREEMRHDLDNAGAALAKLAVTRADAKASWKLKGWRNPPKQLDAFQPKGRALLTLLADAPRALLPEPTPVPMVLEARLDDQAQLQVVGAASKREPNSFT